MKQSVSVLVVMIIALLIGSTFACISAGQNSISNITALPSQVFSKNDTKPPSVNIAYPAYPPTITTGRIIIEGTANDSESGIKTVSASAHVFPFGGNFSINLAPSPISSENNNWSHWSVPLLINTTGTYRVVISASDNAGNNGYSETTINAILSPSEAAVPKIAFVRPSFTEAAYSDHGFYTFYYKYKFPPFGKKITTDLDMFTVKTPVSIPERQNETGLRHLSNLTALIPLNGTELRDVSFDGSPDPQKFWMPFVDHVKKAVPSAIVTVMRDEDVNDGHIFSTDKNKTNAYDILLLFHNEYVTQDEYNNLKQFVSKGGTIVFIDSNIFYGQVRYDKDNRTVTLVKGHNWQFDGKAASRSVSERWYNDTKEWVGGNFLENDIHDNITFTNNPFNYTHFEEQFVNNPKAKIIIDYGIKFPKDYLVFETFPPDKKDGNITVATYSLNYGKGKVIMMGLYGQNLAENERFIKVFDNLIIHQALCSNLQPCNMNKASSSNISHNNTVSSIQSSPFPFMG